VQHQLVQGRLNCLLDNMLILWLVQVALDSRNARQAVGIKFKQEFLMLKGRANPTWKGADDWRATFLKKKTKGH